MANGKLGSWNLSAGINQAIYVCNKEQATVLTLNIVNRNTVPADIRVAISTSATDPGLAEYIEFDVEILPKGVLERTGLVISPNQYLIVKSDVAQVNAVCWGIEVGDTAYSNNISPNPGTTPTWVTPAGSLGTLISNSSTDRVAFAATDPYNTYLKYNVASGSLPPSTALTNEGILVSNPNAIDGYSPAGVTSTFDIGASNGTNTAIRSFSITQQWSDGSSQAKAAPSAQYIKNLTGTVSDGAYWINTGTVSQQVYCIMNTAVSGGGWMMAMKGTRGATFNYNASFWTTDNILNVGDATRNDADAKHYTFNNFQAKDMLAFWPDLSNGGDITGQGYGTTWLENNFYAGNRISLLQFFRTANNYRPSNLRIRGTQWNGGSQFSSQAGNQWYGWNFTQNANSQVRWGFAWNNETEFASNDVTGGIGTQMNGGYSAGDYIGCCQDVTGFNRTARFEMYVR